MADFKLEIKSLLSQGDLEEALLLAKQQALAGCTDLDTPVTMLSMKWESAKKNVQIGRLSMKDESTERQNITYSLLELVKDINPVIVPATASPTIAQPDKSVILFVGANPFKNIVLELEREIEEVSTGLSQFGKRDAFDFRAKMHVTPADMQRMLLESEYAPRFIHFAGSAVVQHPTYGDGVIFEDEDGQPRTIKGDVLAMIFSQFPSVECVFLNTCDSGPSALAVGQKIPFVIGMNSRVYNESAIVFAVAFYEAIAGGRDVPFAFQFAKMRLLTGRYPEQASVPILVVNGQCSDPVYVAGGSHLDTQSGPRVSCDTVVR